jgi:SAM-dependent methyltransferase
MDDSFSTVAEAFSRMAARQDSLLEDNPHQARLRDKVYRHVQRHLPENAHILELNAGTGMDAVELARRGYRIHATDIAPGMLGVLNDKVERLGLRDRITSQLCSFTELDQLRLGPFDAVFSNMGGLNCIRDLSPVIDGLKAHLRPGAIVTWVLMPRICLWELAEVLRGRPRLALRRLAPGGTRAQLEGLSFSVYYFSPAGVLDWFGPAFECLAIEGLSVFTPTADSRRFALLHPRLYRWLSRLDDRLAPLAPWRGWGDFFVLTVKYRP